MRVINFGSINIDHVYHVPYFVRPGETLLSRDYVVHVGGKGANQSVALARAGAQVLHAGKIGPDGRWVRDFLARASVDTSLILEDAVPTGHAIIQVTPEGQNCILLYGGANHTVSNSDIEGVLSNTDRRDIILLQNETNATEHIVQRSVERGLALALNPAPMDERVMKLPLGKIRYLILNEIEGAQITGTDDPKEILSRLGAKCPATEVILTLGALGVLYGRGNMVREVAGHKVAALDTTGAGDAFMGYFLAAASRGESIDEAVRVANKAAAICVTRPGAAESIPRRDEVDASPLGR